MWELRPWAPRGMLVLVLVLVRSGVTAAAQNHGCPCGKSCLFVAEYMLVLAQNHGCPCGKSHFLQE